MADTVTVASKMPHGMVLREHKPRTFTPPQGGVEVTEHVATGRTIEIAGLNSPDVVRFGHAMTEVDAEFWHAWVKANSPFPPIEAGHIFALGKPEDTKAKAKDMEKEKTGLEPLDPERPSPGIERADDPDRRPTRGRR